MSELVRFPAVCVWSLALVSMACFLFAPREHTAITIPFDQWQPADVGTAQWQWPLPDQEVWRARAQTPRRDSSFLFFNGRLIPLAFPYDNVPESDRDLSGWHQVVNGRLEFRLPGAMPVNSNQSVSVSGGDEIAQGDVKSLLLELNGAMSVVRQLALAVFIMTMLGAALFARLGSCFGTFPLAILAGMIPAVVPISLYLCAFDRLPLVWRATPLGIAFDRLDAVAPGLLLVYALCAWMGSGKRQGGMEETQHTASFIRIGWLAGMTLFLVSFTRMLAWGVGTTHPWSPISGSSLFNSAVQYSDAAGYLQGSYHVLSEGVLDQWNQRRPINAIFLAFRLVIGGWNVDLAKWFQAIGVAFSACWAARELARIYGWQAGIAALSFFWGCGRLFLTTTLTEPLGFMLGSLALVGLLHHLRTGKPVGGLCGCGFMAFAQSARPGSLFVLPGLIVWAGLKERSWRRRLSGLLMSTLMVGLVMGITPVLLRLYGTGDNIAGSNFAYTFAGLASGQSWSEVIECYQERLEELANEKEAAKFLYHEGFRLIWQQPHVFIGEMRRGLAKFLTEVPRFLIGITFRSNIDASSPAIALQVILICFVGLLAIIRQIQCRCRQDWSMWTMLFASLFISVPFVFSDGSLRVLVATWPAVLAWLATGLARCPTTDTIQAPCDTDRTSSSLAILLSAMIGIVLFTPWSAHQAFGKIGSSAKIQVIVSAVEPTNHKGSSYRQLPDRGEGIASVTRQTMVIDRRMRGPGVRVGRNGQGSDLTPEEWQRELQLTGIAFSPCLISLVPDAPFRFDQVYDVYSGQLKILFLPADLANTASGTMAIETCLNIPTFGRSVGSLKPGVFFLSDH